MDYSLLIAQSTFSLEDIFLIYLKIDPADYKLITGVYSWHEKSDENHDWGDGDINITSRIYGMRNSFLKNYKEIVTKEKIDNAYTLYNNLKLDTQNDLLKTQYTDTSTDQVFISRENIYQWFVEHQLEWPDELKPFNLDSELESAKDKIKGQDKLIQELKNQVEKNIVPEKWRQAFEYESKGLNALYNLIEKYYFDDAGKPIYDTKKLPYKYTLESDWLAARTLAEADTIITSGKRKGVNDK